MGEKENIIPKQEAHLWLSLHEFITSEQLRNSYEITQFRKKNLMQVNLIRNFDCLFIYFNMFDKEYKKSIYMYHTYYNILIYSQYIKVIYSNTYLESKIKLRVNPLRIFTSV